MIFTHLLNGCAPHQLHYISELLPQLRNNTSNLSEISLEIWTLWELCCSCSYLGNHLLNTRLTVCSAKFIVFDTKFLGFDTKFIGFDTKFIVFDTQFLGFDTKFIVFDTQFLVFTHDIAYAAGLPTPHCNNHKQSLKGHFLGITL